jgi:hypothetical protein
MIGSSTIVPGSFFGADLEPGTFHFSAPGGQLALPPNPPRPTERQAPVKTGAGDSPVNELRTPKTSERRPINVVDWLGEGGSPRAPVA